jgi:hypothetical protein
VSSCCSSSHPAYADVALNQHQAAPIAHAVTTMWRTVRFATITASMR